MPDHIHIFIGYYLNDLIPDLVEKIKTSGNSWIKEKNYQNSNLTGPAAAGVMEHLLIPVPIRYGSKVCFKSGSASSKEIIPARTYRNAY